MSKLKTTKNTFMRISSEVQKGMSKAKNAPAREYAKNPKSVGVGKAATKGLPEKGSMGAKEAPKLNAGAQKAKDLADSRRATVASREASKRAKSVRKMAVASGLASKSEAVADAKKAQAFNREKGRYERSRRPNKTSGKFTTAQKVIGGIVGAIATGGIAINADRKMKGSAPSKGGSGPSTRGGARGKAPTVQQAVKVTPKAVKVAPKTAPVKKAPAKKAPAKASPAPAKPATPTMSPTPTIGGKTFEQMQSDYAKSGQKSYDEHTAYFNSGEVQKVNKAPEPPKQKWYKRKYK